MPNKTFRDLRFVSSQEVGNDGEFMERPPSAKRAIWKAFNQQHDDLVGNAQRPSVESDYRFKLCVLALDGGIAAAAIVVLAKVDADRLE